MALRRPLLVALILGCAISLMTSARLTVRLVVPATLYWSFVPLCEIGSLAVVARRRKIGFAELIDRYFESHTAWLLWAAVFAAIWAWAPHATVYRWMADRTVLDTSALAVLTWSAYLDFRFFRQVLERSPLQAARDLAVQRSLSWAVGLALFVTPAGYQVLVSAVGL